MLTATIVFLVMIISIWGCKEDTTKEGVASPSFIHSEKEEVEGYNLHIYVSNQSFKMPSADIQIKIGDEEIFSDKEMEVGIQHTWEEININRPAGKYTLALSERGSRTNKSEIIEVNKELWIAVEFHYPPGNFKVHVFKKPIAFM